VAKYRKVKDMSEKQRRAFFASLAQKMHAQRGDYILFHATDKKNIASIQKQGLTPHGRSVRAGIHGVFLAPAHTVDEAINWAKYGSQGSSYKGKVKVLAVRVPGKLARRGTRNLASEAYAVAPIPLAYRPVEYLNKERAWREFFVPERIDAKNIKRLTKRETTRLLHLNKLLQKRMTARGIKYIG